MNKIISIEIINNKAISLFFAEPKGGNLEISGGAGTGKTTAADSLWSVFTKSKGVISNGEKRGSISIKVGDGSDSYYLAERIMTPKTNSIKVVKFIGKKKIPVNTKDFEAMLSKLSVNPHKISKMLPTEQIKVLMAAAESDIDLDSLDESIAEAESDRKFAGRAAKESKPVTVPEATEPVSVAELIAERDTITLCNGKINDFSRLVKSLVDEQLSRDATIKSLKEQLATAEAAREESAVKIDKGNAWLNRNKPESTAELDKKIGAAEDTNRLAAVYEQAKKDQADHEYLVTLQTDANKKVEKLRKTKKDALDAVVWPLDAISVSDGVIAYNGIPLTDLGDSETMLVCAAIALGDIKKHEIWVARMDGIESMSATDYNQLKNLYNEHGVQVISTRVSRGDLEPGEITITNGEYKEVA